MLKMIFRVMAMMLTVLLLTGCKTELYSDLPEDEANDMMAILLKNGIGTEKVKNKKGNRYSLMVEESATADAITIFKQLGYPREKFQSIETIFKKEGLVSSPLEERLRFIYALEQEIQETLSQIDGVLTARVKIVLPENNPFGEQTTPSSASVFIKYIPNAGLENIRSEIKLIVEKSIEGLDYDKVSVVMLPSQILSEFEGGTQWGDVLGARVPQGSVATIYWVIGGLLLLVFLLIAGGVFYWWRLNKKAQDIPPQNSNGLSPMNQPSHGASAPSSGGGIRRPPQAE